MTGGQQGAGVFSEHSQGQMTQNTETLPYISWNSFMLEKDPRRKPRIDPELPEPWLRSLPLSHVSGPSFISKSWEDS